MVLTVAGSDSGGGAGIQADIKTLEARGVFAASALTAVTGQNTRGVHAATTLDPDLVRAQVDAVVEDLAPAAAKTGMLGNASIVEVVAEALPTDLPLVVDPVMVAQSGHRLLDGDAEEVLARELAPRATLLTPNVPEAEALTGRTIETAKGMEQALPELLALGCDAVLLKGGHLARDGDAATVVDLLHDGSHVHRFEAPRIMTDATHGTGCTLSAAVAAELARGQNVVEAVETARAHLRRSLRNPLGLGAGAGPVHHLAELRNEAARGTTLEAVEAAAARLTRLDLAHLLPEVGTNLALATPQATGPGDVAGFRQRLVPRSTPAGAAVVGGGAAFGASRHVADFLLALREHDPRVRCAVNLRHGEDVLEALRELDLDVFTIPWEDEPEHVRSTEGATMRWEAQVTMQGREAAPDAVVDPGRFGKEAMVKLVGPDGATVVGRVRELAEATRPT